MSDETLSRAELEDLRLLLADCGHHVREAVSAARDAALGTEAMAGIADKTVADTIYQIDKVAEASLLAWFARRWPASAPVELVMEGLEGRGPVTFPSGTPVAATRWKCLMDPVDGTRGIMFDKRSAWVLAGVAPQRGEANTLGDIVVACMTELPVSRQRSVEQVSAVLGGGVHHDVFYPATGRTLAGRASPSQTVDVRHGFASLCRFFPEGKALLGVFEEELWTRLYGPLAENPACIFEDQYISTGGQLFEILAGRERMVADIRPLAYRRLGFDVGLSCHPYDICTALVLREAGCVVEAPDGGLLSAPLDTVTPVAWVAYANANLAACVRPVLASLAQKHFGPYP